MDAHTNIQTDKSLSGVVRLKKEKKDKNIETARPQSQPSVLSIDEKQKDYRRDIQREHFVFYNIRTRSKKKKDSRYFVTLSLDSLPVVFLDCFLVVVRSFVRFFFSFLFIDTNELVPKKIGRYIILYIYTQVDSPQNKYNTRQAHQTKTKNKKQSKYAQRNKKKKKKEKSAS